MERRRRKLREEAGLSQHRALILEVFSAAIPACSSSRGAEAQRRINQTTAAVAAIQSHHSHCMTSNSDEERPIRARPLAFGVCAMAAAVMLTRAAEREMV